MPIKDEGPPWAPFAGSCGIDYVYMGVSKNRGTPKSSILIRFSIIDRPFWDTGNTHILYVVMYKCIFSIFFRIFLSARKKHTKGTTEIFLH